MKEKRITALWSLPIMAGTIALSSAHAQQVCATEWTADPETPGHSEDTTCSTDVPTAGGVAEILHIVAIFRRCLVQAER